MDTPLLEVELTLHFNSIEMDGNKLRYFQTINGENLPIDEKGELPVLTVFHSKNRTESFSVSADRIKIRSIQGTSYPRLREHWSRLIESFMDVFSIHALSGISLCYLNEIELQNLSSFGNYVNISFDMPPALMERIEFFRSEFTYKYDFGEIHVFLQPDWEDRSESYCILLSLESRHLQAVAAKEVLGKIQQLHEGIKDVFRQILSRDFINRLPQ